MKLQEILDRKAAEQSHSLRRETRALQEGNDPEIKIRNAIQGLSPEERDAVELIVCRGLSYQQAAKSLNTSITTINNRKYRGLQKLKQFDLESEDLRRRA